MMMPARELLRVLVVDDSVFYQKIVKDILAELEKPGRDPRPEFKTATFKEGVNEVADLQPGMVLANSDVLRQTPSLVTNAND